MDINLKDKIILVVDDELDLREIIASEFQFQGAQVFLAENVAKALIVLENNKIDLVVSDIRMPGATGIDLLDMMKKKNMAIPPLILITGFADISLEDAFNRGAEALVNKPFRLDDLVETSYRLLLSTNERWSMEINNPLEKLSLNFKNTFSETMNSKDLLMGRGGMSLKFNEPKDYIRVNDRIQFEFTFKDTVINGVGICRWIRTQDSDNGCTTFLGLEFYCLQKSSLDIISNHLNQNSPLPFIPAIS